MSAKNTPAKKATTKKAPAKKAPAKKATTKKAAAKKAPAKADTKKKTKVKNKVVALVPDDPGKLRPQLFKSRVKANDPAQKTKVLSGMMSNVRKSVETLSERSAKRPVRLFTPAQLRRTLVPTPYLPFQQMLGSIGFRTPVAMEIIAPEHMGSTTFTFECISWLLDMGCYSIYCECEGKQMEPDRIKRVMDRDPKQAVLKVNAIEYTEARTLAQCDEVLRQTVKDLRKRCDADPETKGNPIFFWADPWSGLMSAAEAKGNSDWGLAANAKKEAAKDTTDGSNFGHAKHAQGMARWLPAFMEQHNCIVVFVNKQNDKIDMGAKKGSAAFAAPSPLKNDTRVGGRALKRLCAYRLTMLRLYDIREKGGEKRVYGYHNRMMLVKNSYGPRDRTCEFSVYFDCHEDRPDYLAPAISWDDRTAQWMAKYKLLGTTLKDDLFTCDVLGCVAVPAEELVAALYANPEQVEFIGGQLGIEGYAKPVMDIAPDPDNDSTELDDEDEDPPEVPEDDDDDAGRTYAPGEAPEIFVEPQDEEEAPSVVPT